MTSATAKFLPSIMAAFTTLGILAPPAALGQLDRSRCADCHVANPYREPAQEHLHRWSLSPHGRASVGIHRCGLGSACVDMRGHV